MKTMHHEGVSGLSKKSYKRLGITLAIVTVLLAAVGYWLWSDLQDIRDERAKNVELAYSGHPMGGRFLSKSEMDAEAMKADIASALFIACIPTLALACYCFYKFLSQREEDPEPVR